MVITKKEKVLIFVLVLILLVGGTYTLGIMPSNSTKKDTQAELDALASDIEKVKAEALEYSPDKLGAMKRQISDIDAEIRTYADPSAAITEDNSMPVWTDGFEDAARASDRISAFLGDKHVCVTGDNTLAKLESKDGYIVYTFDTTFKCVCLDDLYRFLDSVAAIPSYTVKSLTVSDSDEAGFAVKGSLIFAVKLLGDAGAVAA